MEGIFKGISSIEYALSIAKELAKKTGLEYVIMKIEDGSYAFQQNTGGWFKEGDVDILGNKIIKIVR